MCRRFLCILLCVLITAACVPACAGTEYRVSLSGGSGEEAMALSLMPERSSLSLSLSGNGIEPMNVSFLADSTCVYFRIDGEDTLYLTWDDIAGWLCGCLEGGDACGINEAVWSLRARIPGVIAFLNSDEPLWQPARAASALVNLCTEWGLAESFSSADAVPQEADASAVTARFTPDPEKTSLCLKAVRIWMAELSRRLLPAFGEQTLIPLANRCLDVLSGLLEQQTVLTAGIDETGKLTFASAGADEKLLLVRATKKDHVEYTLYVSGEPFAVLRTGHEWQGEAGPVNRFSAEYRMASGENGLPELTCTLLLKEGKKKQPVYNLKITQDPSSENHAAPPDTASALYALKLPEAELNALYSTVQSRVLQAAYALFGLLPLSVLRILTENF